MGQEIKICGPADKEGRHPFSIIEIPLQGEDSYKVPLTDSLLKERLREGELNGVCKEQGQSTYYLVPQIVSTLKQRLDPRQQCLALMANTNLNIAASVATYSPAPYLEDPAPDPAEYVTSSMPLCQSEIAIIRNAMLDSRIPDRSYTRRVPAYREGVVTDGDKSYYAFLVSGMTREGVTEETFNRIEKALQGLFTGDDLPDKIRIRVGVLTKEVEEWKRQYLDKPLPPRELVIPDDFFAGIGNPKEIRAKIRQLQGTPLPVQPRNIDMDDVIQCRVLLYSSEIAFMRYILGDSGNEAFISYFSGPKQGDNAEIYFINRDIDWDKLISALVALQNFYGQNPKFNIYTTRLKELIREMDRLDTKVKDEDFWYNLFNRDSSVALAFVGLGLAPTTAYGLYRGVMWGAKWAANKWGNGGGSGTGKAGGGEDGGGLDRAANGHGSNRDIKAWEWPLIFIVAAAAAVFMGPRLTPQPAGIGGGLILPDNGDIL